MLVVLGAFCQLGWSDHGVWGMVVGWYIHLHAGTLQVGLPGSGSAYDKRHMNYGMRARGGIIYLYDDSMTFMQRDDVS